MFFFGKPSTLKAPQTRIELPSLEHHVVGVLRGRVAGTVLLTHLGPASAGYAQDGMANFRHFGSNAWLNNSTLSSTPSPTAQTTTSNQTAAPTAIHSGVTKMLSITETLKAAINTGDEATVKTTGPQLEDAWSPFEDNAKQKYPDLYKKIENYLDPTIAGSKASPMDKQTLGTLNGELTKALKELSTKE